MVRLAGFEPATLGLEGRCSIQMSYRRITQNFLTFQLKTGRGSRIRTYDPLYPKQMRYQAALCPDQVKLRILMMKRPHVNAFLKVF